MSKELEPTKVLEEQGEPSTPQTKGMNKRRADSVSESIHSGGNNKKIASSGPTSERLLAAKADARSLPSNESKAASLGESTGSKWRNDGQKREVSTKSYYRMYIQANYVSVGRGTTKNASSLIVRLSRSAIFLAGLYKAPSQRKIG